jgi:TfoX/Sxy family transcriptional regulator of competence genes
MASKWKRSSDELVQRFKSALPGDAEVELRSMFGYPAAFVRGNFFSGLFEELVVVRMPAPQRSKLAALANAGGFNPMGGKPMTDWYLKEALALVKELPAKKKK